MISNSQKGGGDGRGECKDVTTQDLTQLGSSSPGPSCRDPKPGLFICQTLSLLKTGSKFPLLLLLALKQSISLFYS